MRDRDGLLFAGLADVWNWRQRKLFHAKQRSRSSARMRTNDEQDAAARCLTTEASSCAVRPLWLAFSRARLRSLLLGGRQRIAHLCCNLVRAQPGSVIEHAACDDQLVGGRLFQEIDNRVTNSLR